MLSQPYITPTTGDIPADTLALVPNGDADGHDLYYRDGTAEPALVGGSGSGGVFATGTQYGLLYSGCIRFDGGLDAVTYERGPLAPLAWALDGGAFVAPFSGGTAEQVLASATVGAASASRDSGATVTVTAAEVVAADFGDVYVQVWGTLSA